MLKSRLLSVKENSQYDVILAGNTRQELLQWNVVSETECPDDVLYTTLIATKARKLC